MSTLTTVLAIAMPAATTARRGSAPSARRARVLPTTGCELIVWGCTMETIKE